jgi:ion channel POLLUX/CASTOR
MPKKISFSKRIRYAIDNLFSKGPAALILWLGIFSFVLIIISTVVLTSTRLAPGAEEPYSFVEAFWTSLLRTLGSGSIGGRESTWGFRLLMLVVTFGGVFIISTLIGILTTGMQTKLLDLRKGRSEVVENGHTVLLGWTEQVFTILKELIQANVSEQRASIVILGPLDKVEMEDQIRHKINKSGNSRVICRTGNPMDMDDLRLVNLNAARSIIVLSPEGDSGDTDVLKTVLAITNHPERRKEKYHIVASLRNPKNMEIAWVIGKDEVEWIQVGEVVARMVAQTCRQSGLSVVYTGLLDFGGDEFYFYSEPRLAGKTFGEALGAYDQGVVVGICPQGGKPILNPPHEQILKKDDQLIMVASDNNQVVREQGHDIQEDQIVSQKNLPIIPEHTLILGWNWRGITILREMDHYVAKGSQVQVVADHDGVAQASSSGCQDLENLSVCFQVADTTDRSTLEQLSLEKYDHIIILCYSDRMTNQQADAHTLITLLHLRDIADQRNLNFSIVSELLDTRNRKLALVSRADDFIISERIISLMMTQVAENKALNAIFTDLFDPSSSEIYLRPARNYISIGQAVNFYTVVEAARRRKEVAIGYRKVEQSHDANKMYGVVLNPVKSEKINFTDDDMVIVLAEK